MSALYISELEYARNLGKAIIPLKIQSRYNPDGWLGQVREIMSIIMYYNGE